MPMRPADHAVFEKCTGFLRELGIDNDREIAAEMMQSIIKLVHDDPGRGEMKLMMRSFKELRYAFKIFKPYRGRRKISMFGSARTAPDNSNYISAVEFGRLSAQAGFMVITGAGGGIMAAGHEGAGIASSFGVAIRLPFEQRTNAVIEGDQKLIHFRYFFSRKLVFVKETHAIVLYPGGFGTHDEGFEVLTLVQTGRCDPLPIVLIAAKGDDYWQAWDQFVRRQLMADGLISPEDTGLYFITDDPRAGVEHIQRFYRNYHSLRYIKDDLILRIRHAPTPAELAALCDEFADIIVGGTMLVRSSIEADMDTALVPEMPRLMFRFDRRSLARLRLLIDRLNTLPSLPPMESEAPRSGEVGAEVSDRNVGHIAEEEGIKLAGPGT